MKKTLSLAFAIILFVSCNDASSLDSFITSPIDDDFSSIAEPRERWEAYKLSDYKINQSWACECFPPTGCDAFIINNSIADVDYKLSKESYYGRSEEEIYNYTKRMAFTIDEAFDIIEKYKTSAHRIDVEYDSRYGYPAKIFIDIDSLMADEEIIRRFGNLQKIIN